MSEKPTLFDRFGGTRKMGEALGEPPSTVQSWKSAGRIPAFKQPDVLAKAIELGLEVTAEDIIFPLGRDGIADDPSASATKSANNFGSNIGFSNRPDNRAENICIGQEGADSPVPFSVPEGGTAAISPTCSPMSAPRTSCGDSPPSSSPRASAP